MQAEQHSLRRLIGQQEREHRRYPEDRHRHAEDRERSAHHVAPRAWTQRSVGTDRQGDQQPDDRSSDHDGGRRPRRGKDDVGDRSALVERESEVTDEDAAQEPQVLHDVRPVGAQFVADLGKPLGGRIATSGTQRRRRPGKAGDHEEQHPSEEGDDDDLDDTTAQPTQDEARHRRAFGSIASRSPSPRRLNANIVTTSASPGTIASAGTTRYSPELTPSDSIWPQLAVGGGTPTPR